TAGERDTLAATLTGPVVADALSRYEELFRQLAVECPEVAFWADQVDHQATRARLSRLTSGMDGLGEILRGIAAGGVPDERRESLARAHASELARPIVSPAAVPDGLMIPLLAEGYVNPDFRVAEAGPGDRPAVESWWRERRVRVDLPGFLVGHLTAPQAT